MIQTMVQGIGAIVLRVSKATLTFHMAAKVTIPISIYNVILTVEYHCLFSMDC